MITIEEFTKITGIKEKTIRGKRDKIPGLTYKDGVYEIMSGTRYPCDLHRYTLNDSAKKRYVLLKMISKNKYICHSDLNLYQEQFETMLRELLDAELIQPNGVENHYGANAYDCTIAGENILKEKKNYLQKISNLIASTTGRFVGSIISEVAA